MVNNKKAYLQGAGILVVMIVLSAAGFMAADILPNLIFPAQASSDLDEGLSYLENQSLVDVDPIRQKLKQIRLETISQKALEDESALFAGFDGSMILGDSRASGFYYYGFLPKSICLAEMNETIRNVSDYTSQVAAAKPEYLYISYGINDVKARMGLEEEDGYAKIAEEQIDQVLAVSPQTKIVLSSVIPAAPGILSQEENEILADYNRQLEALCEHRGWIYVDNDPLIALNPDGFGPDGIHFEIPFYPKWAANMLTNVWLQQES